MDLSVVIVNFNVKYFLEQCILSVIAASKNKKIEIIVVDNNSVDDSCALLEANFPEVILIKNKENVGFSKANNQGVAVCKGTYVLLLNPDTVVSEDTFDLAIEFANTKTNFGALGVKLIDGSGNFLFESKRGIPTPMVAFNKLFGISSNQSGKYYATHLGENEIGRVDVLVGAFMLIKRQVFNEVNGFDESFFMYGEDIDLSYRILKNGYQNYYFSETHVIHYKGECIQKDIKYLKHFLLAMKIFYKKHFKLNILYDFVVGLGIKLWYWSKYLKFKRPSSSAEKMMNLLYFGEDEEIVFYLGKNHLLIKQELNRDLDKIRGLIKQHNIDTLLFDNESFSYKSIINYFQLLKNDSVNFKIRPKGTHYLVGSSNSVDRGVIDMVQ